MRCKCFLLVINYIHKTVTPRPALLMENLEQEFVEDSTCHSLGCLKGKLSNEKRALVVLGYVKNEILPSYIGTDSYYNQPAFYGKYGRFFFVAQLGPKFCDGSNGCLETKFFAISQSPTPGL